MTTSKDIGTFYEQVEARVDTMRLTVHMHARDYQEIRSAVEAHRADNEEPYATIGWGGEQLQGIIVQWHLRKDDTMETVAPFLAWVLQHGWEAKPTDENAEWGYRQYNFSKMENNPPLFWNAMKEWKPYMIRLSVRVWVNKSDGAKCKKVEAGTQPTYKLICS